MDIFSEEILHHYKHPCCTVPLAFATQEASGENVSCGDKVSVRIACAHDRIDDISIIVTGCAISTAFGSLVAQEVKGKTISEVLSWDDATVLSLADGEVSSARKNCAFLAIRALRKALLQ